MSGVLSGVRVVELASWTYVPAAGVALADWGADVIKVESVVGGDPGRALVVGGFTRQAARADTDFILELSNRGKRSIAVDLKTRCRPGILRSAARRGRCTADELAAGSAGAGSADGRRHPRVQPEHHHRARNRPRCARPRPRSRRLRRRHLSGSRRGRLHAHAVRHRKPRRARPGLRRPAGRNHPGRRRLCGTVPP